MTTERSLKEHVMIVPGRLDRVAVRAPMRVLGATSHRVARSPGEEGAHKL